MRIPAPLRHWLHDRKIRARTRRLLKKVRVIERLPLDDEAKLAAIRWAKKSTEKKLEEYAD